MTIRTERLILRPATLSDVDLLHELWTEPDVRRYLWDGDVIDRTTAEDTVRALSESFETVNYGLWIATIGEPTHPAVGAVVGFGYLKEFDEPAELEIGYGLAPDHWHSGFATEIARALLRYGFEDLQRPRLFARTDLPNLASVRVMERAGMQFDRQTDEGAFGGLIIYRLDRS